jgi:multidrug resistance efflux pump
MTSTNVEAIESRCRELLREKNEIDCEWIRHRRSMANMNAVYAAKLSIADRKLKEAKTRLKLAQAEQRGNQALQDLKEFVPTFNHDSERLAQSIDEANALLAACNPEDVRIDSQYNPKYLPMLLQTADGQIVMRPRGL